jgi:hypothetical protein
MNRTLVGLLALVALLIATPLMAQQRGRGGRGGFGQITKAQVLANENVQKELEIVADQKEQIAAIVEEAAQGRRGGGRGQDLTDEERAKRDKERAERIAALDKKIDAVLVGPQKTRLNEIYVQALGSQAFSNPEIAKELGVGPDLQEKIAEARREAMQAAFQDGGGGPEAFAKARAESDKAVMALLSADQKAKFEKMKGKPVSFDISTIGRGGRGGRRGGGGNQ